MIKIKQEETGSFEATKSLEEPIKEQEEKLAALKAKKVEEAEKEKEAVKSERAKDIAKVQDAANSYLKIVAENAETQKAMKAKEEEAYKLYKAELDSFSDKHKGYHLTYTRNGNNVEFKIEENHTISVEKYLKDQQERFKKIWNSFWF